MNEKHALDALAALSQETRLRIVRHLVPRGDTGAPAGEIAAAVGASPSRVSFHLSALERAGLVDFERRSRKIVYRANLEALGGLVSFLLTDCCGNHPVVARCCAPAGGER